MLRAPQTNRIQAAPTGETAQAAHRSNDLLTLQRAADSSPIVQRLHRLAQHPMKPAQRIELSELVMKSGELEDLKAKLDGQFDVWPELAAALVKASQVEDQAIEGGLMICGDLTIPGPETAFEDAVFTAGTAKIPEPLRRQLKVFLLSFMKANGQLEYLQAQDWFKDGSWKAVLEVNFYPDREFSEETDFLGAHKDTDSRNLFVNLIFNNPTKIPATEWTLDEHDPDPTRMAELQKLLPEAELKKILAIKRGIKDLPEETPGKGKYEGGVTGKNTYVSWVDEAVWHATPAPKNRQRFEKDLLVGFVRGEVGDDYFYNHYYRKNYSEYLEYYKDEVWDEECVRYATWYRKNGHPEEHLEKNTRRELAKFQAKMDIVADRRAKTYILQESKDSVDLDFRRPFAEAMLILMENPKSILHQVVKTVGEITDLSTANKISAGIIKPPNKSWEPVKSILLKEIEAVDWAAKKRTGYFGRVEIFTGDPSVEKGREVVTKTGGRPRANSDADTQREVAKAIAAMKGIVSEVGEGGSKDEKTEVTPLPAKGSTKGELPKRSFIRTWVTLVKNKG